MFVVWFGCFLNGRITMSRKRKLIVDVMVENFPNESKDPKYSESGYTMVSIRFSRKLNRLEVSGVRAALEVGSE
jgi:hypothetical protein